MAIQIRSMISPKIFKSNVYAVQISFEVRGPILVQFCKKKIALTVIINFKSQRVIPSL